MTDTNPIAAPIVYALSDTELTDVCRACGTAGHSIQNCPAIRAEMEDAPGPDHDTRGEPATLRRTINDAINTYIAYECETDSERATELAVEYMFSEYGLKDGPLDRLMTDNTRMMGELTKERATIAALRLALDEAHQHVGALGQYAAALEMMLGIAQEGPPLTAARAWLRRA